MALIVFGVILSAAGCTTTQLRVQSSAFNQAASDSNINQLVTNVVRSSLDLPMTFTAFNQFTGKEYVSGSVSPNFPFGSDFVTQIYNLNPVVNFGPGISQVTYTDLATTEANELLNKSVSAGALETLIGAIGARATITLFAHKYVVHAELFNEFRRIQKRICERLPNDSRCRNIKRVERECRFPPPSAEVHGELYYSIRNRALDPCDFLEFQAFFDIIALVGVAIDVDSEIVAKAKKTKNGNVLRDEFADPVLAIDRQDVVKFHIQNTRARKRRKAIEKRLMAREARKLPVYRKGASITFVQKSPKQFIALLGRFTALFNSSHEFEPIIPTRSGPQVLFKLIREKTSAVPSDRSIALSVTGPDNHRYYVERPDTSVKNRDLTLRALIIAQELINAAIGKKGLPTPPTILTR